MQSAQWGKLFVKFAGAPTVNARIAPAPAAEALCLAMSAYQALYAHPALVKLLGCGTEQVETALDAMAACWRISAPAA